MAEVIKSKTFLLMQLRKPPYCLLMWKTCGICGKDYKKCLSHRSHALNSHLSFHTDYEIRQYKEEKYRQIEKTGLFGLPLLPTRDKDDDIDDSAMEDLD